MTILYLLSSAEHDEATLEMMAKIDAEEAGKEEHSRKAHEAEKIKGLMEKIRKKK